MPNSDADFRALMEQVRGGCPRAAQEVYTRYSRLIRMIVRNRLHERLRGRFDSTDFVQDVWTSFFLASPSRRDFDSPQTLVAYLARMTENKVIDEHRRLLDTQTYNLNREVTWSGEAKRPDDFSDPATSSPSQQAIADETWESLNAGITPRDRRILQLLRQNYTHREIAEILGIDRKSIRRLLNRLGSNGMTP